MTSVSVSIFDNIRLLLYPFIHIQQANLYPSAVDQRGGQNVAGLLLCEQSALPGLTTGSGTETKKRRDKHGR
jgi:hypothetical protein